MNEIKALGYEIFVILHFLGILFDKKYHESHICLLYTLIIVITVGKIISIGA